MEVRIDKTDLWAPDLLRLRIGAANLIGRNFFSHSDPIATAMERIESVDMVQLMERVPPETPKLHDGETAAGTLTYKNKTSICNLVIWNDDSRRVTHYLAGDANSELEEAIVQWMNYNSDDNKSVMVAKMSHHGASSSNPRSSWARLKPYRVVVLAGDHKSHGHPRWKVLHDMFSWYLYDTSSVLKAKFPLYSGGSGGRKLTVFTASVHVASISLTFVQWRDTSWQSTTPSKRIIKVSIGDMGDIDAPLVGKLKQPFDQLVYMWVSDKATAVVDKAAKPGVTKGDLDALLPGLEHDQDKLFLKSNKEPNDIKPNEIFIEPGSHFMVVATNSKGLQAAVLDYRFNRSKGSEKKERPSGWDDWDEWLIEDGDQNDEDVSKAAFKVSAGPLVFENIGLKYIQEENRLGVVLDASFLMGPIVAVALPSQNPTPQLYLARLLSSALFKVEAQLSPRFFVLHERCHLTGGLALFSWFGDSPHAGDWVMTIGGFHQAFDKPLQYPRPPRLGIAWSLGDNLRITGEAYFAITPRVCMGGGRLHAQLTLGALSAWFDAFLDFLINYRPFCFAAVGGVSIGVRFSLDLWLVTIRISCEIGATLTVAGPPMAGTVHVDFWVFGFDVDFGDKTGMARPDRLSLSDVKALALKSAPSGAPVPLASGWLDVASGQNGDDDADDFDEQEAPPKAFLFNCVGGLVPEGSDAKGPEANAWYEDKPAKIWLVRGDDLSLSITTSFAASDGVLFDDRKGAITPKKLAAIAEAQNKVYALPMCLQQTIISTVESIWGYYDPEKDPVLRGKHVSGLLDGKPADAPPLVMGLTIEPPKPYISRDAIPKFNLVEDLKLTVDSKGFAFKRKETASPMWAPPHQDGSWDNFKEKWQSQPDSRPEEAVCLWAERLKFKGLTGLRPKALLKRFDDIVPVLPLIAVGTGS
ncbi:NAD(P)H-dependent D-xylose reductase xyl1 [Verticillium dahliae VDG1]|nr:NAD(P)H-dependent D-xylose reductase xyl1 [Verticillium dahliae VDG1]